MTTGVVLYGAPATGKSTTAEALEHRGFVAFTPAKNGAGRTEGYRMVNDDELQHMLADVEDIAWTVNRYSATYIWSRIDLINTATRSRTVLQLGQPEAVEAIRGRVPEVDWFVVEVTGPRNVVAERVAARGTGDEVERMRHYDNTPSLPCPDLLIDTSQVTPGQAAQMIFDRMESEAAQ